MGFPAATPHLRWKEGGSGAGSICDLVLCTVATIGARVGSIALSWGLLTHARDQHSRRRLMQGTLGG